MAIAEIRIKYARFLDPYIKELFEFKKTQGILKTDKEYPSQNSIIQKVEEYKEEWQTHKNILEFIQECLDLEFALRIINVNIVGWFRGGISSPVLIGINNYPEDFLDILTHEIIHVLLSDNTINVDLPKILPAMYPDETPGCRVHIIVNSVMKKIYLDFLKEPERLERNIEIDKHFPDYVKAWKIVETDNFESIIQKFKSYYSN